MTAMRPGSMEVRRAAREKKCSTESRKDGVWCAVLTGSGAGAGAGMGCGAAWAEKGRSADGTRRRWEGNGAALRAVRERRRSMVEEDTSVRSMGEVAVKRGEERWSKKQ